MELLKRITYKETFSNNEKQYKSVRVVLLDNKNLVALLYIGKINFHTLPGGTIEEGETPEQAAIREILEETGCDCKIIKPLGIIEENSKTFAWNGVNTCFLAGIKGEKGLQSLTQAEMDDETQVRWFNLKEALQIVSNQEIAARDEREAGVGKITQERDIALLNQTIKVLECPCCDYTENYDVLLESKHAALIAAKDEILTGACFIIPKAHKETPFDLSEAEWLDTKHLLDLAKNHIDEKHKPQGYNLGWNIGSVGGQYVFHAHLHIIPRFADEPFAGKGIRHWFISEENKRN